MLTPPRRPHLPEQACDCAGAGVTRLRLATPAHRFVIGYDQDLATYYVETGPAAAAEDHEDDPDEGLTTVRGRTAGDLPHLAALFADIHARGLTLTRHQGHALNLARTDRALRPELTPHESSEHDPHATPAELRHHQ